TLGSLSARLLRARCKALFTDCTLVSKVLAVSSAVKPSTSRRSKTARWFRRQMLERSNEGELDALVGRVARLWRRLEARVLREVARLRVRLEPRDLRPQRAYVVPRIGRKKLVERHDALRALRGKAQGS